MAHLRLLAPLAGWCSSLEEAPDPVFAGRMLGDGVLIDPTSATVLAPCDGEIILLPATKHAVTLRAAGGIEVLIHVSIDTVGLAGQGFEQHTRPGAHVRAGEPLISFDMETIAQRAKSLVTPVILTEGHGFSVVRRCEGAALRVGDLLMELAVEEGRSSSPANMTAGSSVVRRIQVLFEHGIHARPAALLANSIKRMAADVRISANGRQADARSTIALMSLGARCGDEIVIEASGRDAHAAVEALAGVVGAAGAAATPGSAPGVDAARAPAGDPSRPEAAAAPTPPGGARVMKGVVASRGLAIGRAFRFGRPEVSVAEAGEGVAFESTALENARAAVAAALRQRLATASSTVREIVSAHLELLEDPQFLASSNAWIAKGKSAGWSWKSALRVSIDALRALNDSRMRERIDDLLDLETQVLLALKGAPATSVDIPENAILIARDLLPSQLVSLDTTRVSAICMAGGGPTSHAAILAAAMGIPALVALGSGVLDIANGTRLLVDASEGLLQVDPVDSVLRETQGRLEARGRQLAEAAAAAGALCRMADGTRIEVLANVGSLAEAQAAVRNGAEGCGLLRTEFLFLERTEPPGESEQAARYQEIATAFAGHPVSIRTLDIGGDKPIPYLPLPHEDNPALGLRGVRTSLWNPDLLRVQLRAILRVRPSGQCRILLPMITDAAEVRAVRRMVEEERAAMDNAAEVAVRVGAMIETPAAAITAQTIAREADFLSLGTNDLTQYALAMDRGHAELAPRLDALHPAVLRLIAQTTAAARAHSRTVAVCGGLASDPLAVPVLIGLGVEELSVVPSTVGELKALIGTLDLAECRELARMSLEQESAAAVRAMLARSRDLTAEVTR
jgi:multiphosphoryl transfer protein